MSNDDKMFFQELGERIGVQRREKGLTQADLALRLGCSPQVVAHYEAGRRRVPASLLPQLSEILGITVDEILGTAKLLKAKRPKSQFEQQLKAISKLSRGKQQMVLSMLDAAIKTAEQR